MTPSTPQELMNIQGTDPVDNICDHLFNDLTPQEGWEIAKRIMNATLKLHMNILADKMEKGEVNECVVWTNDTTKIRMIRDLMDQVDM